MINELLGTLVKWELIKVGIGFFIVIIILLVFYLINR